MYKGIANIFLFFTNREKFAHSLQKHCSMLNSQLSSQCSNAHTIKFLCVFAHLMHYLSYKFRFSPLCRFCLFTFCDTGRERKTKKKQHAYFNRTISWTVLIFVVDFVLLMAIDFVFSHFVVFNEVLYIQDAFSPYFSVCCNAKCHHDEYMFLSKSKRLSTSFLF